MQSLHKILYKIFYVGELNNIVRKLCKNIWVIKDNMNNKIAEIYKNIQFNINDLIENINKSQAIKLNEEDSLSALIKQLNCIGRKTKEELESLEKHSNWDRFTIAFYGETGAGKSTLIEALRLFFRESSKLEEQAKFKQIQQEKGLTQEAFNEIEAGIKKLDDELKHIEEKVKSSEQESETKRKNLDEEVLNFDKEIDNLNNEITIFTKEICSIKEKQNFWQKFISLFKVLPEQQQLDQKKIELQAYIKAKEEKELARKQEQLVFERNILELKNEEENLLNKKAELEQKKKKLSDEADQQLKGYADGKIIGDGRSDFTREVAEFNFEIEGKPFTLLDVPGIEGDENKVGEPIRNAIKKAHAIFYTICNPKIEDNTLAKIKKHLSAQTEVWSIYNTRTTSPRAIKKIPTLLSVPEGINDVKNNLTSEFGERYAGNLNISAKPAYLALTESIIPRSEEEKNKNKFLEECSQSEILQKSNFFDFEDKLKNDILKNYKNKIFKASLNKASQVLKETINSTDQILYNYQESDKKIKDVFKNASAQIKNTETRLINELKRNKRKEIEMFEKNIRNYMEDIIEDDVSNDKFKMELEYIKDEELEKLSKRFKVSSENSLKKFDQEINSVITNLARYISTILTRQQKELSNIFAMNNLTLPEINIDNGINKTGLATALTAIAIATAPTTGGLSLLVAGVAITGAVIGAIKSVYGYFSADYRKSQQYNKLSEVLAKLEEEIEKNIDESIDNIKRKTVSKTVNPIYSTLKNTYEDYAKNIPLIKKVKANLTIIYDDIEKQSNNI